ncbi:MAG: hypothetical protein HY077_17950 [Elusimicrobia bacterium]|nr:hypothetical protein [Elusimicrobiota bacterium]
MPPAILGLSFLSGAAGLVYEVIWAKQLAVLIGGTALAQTVVLAAFLGGLAAGNAFFGGRADRSAEPWRYYARLEFGVAGLAAAAPLLLRALDFGPLRWLAAACAAAPAFLMGGTLPALCRAAGGETQSTVGRLYYANSAGAVAGSLLCAFCLIPGLGLDGAFFAGALVNAAVGFGALVLARSVQAPAAPVPREGRDETLTPAVVYAAVFLSGFVALTYEIAWTRLLALVMGSSAYSFCEMLAGFIAGVSLGSWLVSTARARRCQPALLLGLAELGAGISVLATLPAYGRLTFCFMHLRSLFSHGGAAFYAFEAGKFAFCFALMLVPTICLGASLPLAVRLIGPSRGGFGGGVGAVFAANTAGNVLGAFFGYWWMPWLGLQGLIRSGTTVHLAVGAAVLWLVLPWSARRKWAAASVMAAAVFAYRAWMPLWDLRLMSQGLFRSRIIRPPRRFDEFRAHFDGVTMPFYRDDREATVSVLNFPDVETVLKVNGKSDASNGEDMRTQIYVGELPMLLNPRARRVLVVGWGSGITAGSLLRHPIERLDAVELIPAVVPASRHFRAENNGALDDRRTGLRIEDAKTFLRRPGSPYDVIVSEPSNPWMAGVGNLFTAEFYRSARARLAPGGLMVQWFHVYEMDDDLFRIALRTYLSVFPHVTLWNVVDADVLLVGSAEPVAPDFALMEKAFIAPAVWNDLRRTGLSALSTFLGMQSASEASVREMAGTGPLNEDRRPLLEYGAPKSFFRADRVRVVNDHDDRADAASAGSLMLAGYLKARGRPMERREFMDRIAFPHSVFEERVLRRLVSDWMRRYPRDPKAALALYWIEDFKKNKKAAEEARRLTIRLSGRSPSAKKVIIGSER